MSDWLIDAARRPYNRDPELPEGLIMLAGRVQFACRVCGEWTEWPDDPDHFEVGHPANVCGRRPGCCL